MGAGKKIKHYLVQSLGLTNKAVDELIKTGQVSINGVPIAENILLDEFDEIKLGEKTVRPGRERIYLKFYKPRGFESTLSKTVPHNINSFFPEIPGLSIAGRLDKDSEGLLLLSNDGKWVQKIIHPDFEKEKVYVVRTDRAIGENLVSAFTNGIRFGKHHSWPAIISVFESDLFRVILKEGKKRQIRKICKLMEYNVLSLTRIRIDSIELDDLKPGEWRSFQV